MDWSGDYGGMGALGIVCVGGLTNKLFVTCSMISGVLDA